MKDGTFAALILPALALLTPAAHAQSGRPMPPMPPMPPSEQTMPPPMSAGPMKRPMMAPDAMDCQRMHREMMTEMRSLRQEIAELREELRRRRR